MTTYDRFIFESYHFDPEKRLIELKYSLDDKLHFTESFTLPADLVVKTDHPDLEAALFALHLSGGASYYKTYCPRTIEVRSGKLSQAQASFWNDLYTHGMGEFFYRNQLDFHGLINFPVSPEAPTAKPAAGPRDPKRALVPYGGGKDSIVSSEILRAAGLDQTLFRLRSHAIITELADIAGLPLIEVGRTLDPQLFELNKAGAYNGHVPITAHISFLTIVVSLLAGFDSVFFSNERSSSYGNVEYLGMQVNHQWSKSQEFETGLRDYVAGFVTADVAYLNVIRPLSELHIASLFATHPDYFGSATSCNRNWVLTERAADAPRWCGECPKCAFSFALFAAFLPETTVITMFGHNLFEDEALLPLYRELWGIEGFKPFECVGTPEETAAACYLARDKAKFKDTPVMREFTKRVLPGLSDPDALVKELMTPELDLAPQSVRAILKSEGIA